MPRILDFTDGFTSSTEPVSTPFPSSVIPSTPDGIAKYADASGNLADSEVLIDSDNNVIFPAQIRTPKEDVATIATISQLDSSKTFYRFTGAIVTEVQGILAGADGQQITIHNSSSAIVTFKHDDAGAIAVDRFKLTEGSDIDLDPDSSIEFIYDITQARWVIKSGAGTNKLVGYQEVPVGVVNGSNVNFTILGEPVTEDSLIVYKDGLALSNTEWSLTGTSITLSVAPSLGQIIYVFYLSKGTPTSPPIPTGANNVQYPLLIAGDITAKQITLSNTPSEPTKVIVDVIGGSSQIYGEDFSVSGNILTWNGLGMEAFLSNGDRLRIQYFS